MPDRRQPLSASLGLSARMIPRLVVAGEQRERVVHEAEVVMRAGAITSVTGEKVAAGGVSQTAGFEQRIDGHKAEHDAESAAPRTRARRVSIVWNEWEFSTIGFGATVGGVMNALTGDQIGYGPSAIGGGVIFYVWGLWRWWEETQRR